MIDNAIHQRGAETDLYLKPGLGHIRMADLRNQQVRDVYAAMRKINRPAEKAEPSDLMRALLEARAAREGNRVSTRPLSESRIRRVNAVLSAALNEAVTVRHIIPVNPATGIFRATGSRKSGRTRPLLWTAERVEHWEKTGKVPAKVMTWTQAPRSWRRKRPGPSPHSCPAGPAQPRPAGPPTRRPRGLSAQQWPSRRRDDLEDEPGLPGHQPRKPR